MSSTGTILRTAAQLYAYYGHHNGPHFAGFDGRLDPVAAIFRAITGHTPHCFIDDDDIALLLITTNAPAMDAIRALSAVLPTEPPLTDGVVDHIEHISDLTAYAALGQPPATPDVVLGNFARAAQAADTLASLPTQRPHAA
ncbi:hypothetical protein ACFQ0X_44020 [Streptomyces rectiviolaceus]|uniref:Uncharacterized protein n=1 Tax=Streptomyces rectiviolaceus TaxID=332591 RepID=A0ABP6NNK3_9ACTN